MKILHFYMFTDAGSEAFVRCKNGNEMIRRTYEM